MPNKPADFTPFYLKVFHLIEEKNNNEFANKLADSQLQAYANGCISDKIKIARKQGHSDWWKESETPIECLRELLAIHVAKGDMVDVAIFAMMIHARECAAYEESRE